MDYRRSAMHHRSISQLLGSIESMPSSVGQSNPALNDEGSTNGDTRDKRKVRDANNEDDDEEEDEEPVSNTTARQSSSHDQTGTAAGADTTAHSLVVAAWNCLHNETLSPDSEYDEALAFPDSVTILSMGGDNPVLVERDKNDEEDGDSLDAQLNEVPYLNIYKPPVKFTAIQRKVFLPDVEIEVRIVDHERSSTTHLLNPNLYTIELKHGPYVWSVKKRYKHFYALHQQLRVYRATLNIPFPTRTHKERRASFRNNYCETPTPASTPVGTTEKGTGATGNSATGGEKVIRKETKRFGLPTRKKKKKKGTLPRFPNKPDSLVPVESVPERQKQLQDYLYNLLTINLYRNHHETVSFLEVSELSFVNALGLKGKEGPIQKRTGSTHPGQAGCNFCGCFQNSCCIRCSYFFSDMLCRKWRDRWFFIKDTFFGYVNPKNGQIRSVVLYDQGFEVSTGIYSTGMRNGLQITTYSRQFIVKCWTRRKAKEWMNFLKVNAKTTALAFTQQNPFNSYAPVRKESLVGWFVDGANYMSCVADALENASEEIFIADWWLSPEIYMKRPAIDGDYWRLDKILLRKAQQGVKVFVLLYKEVEMALGINSYYSKQVLASSHENIKILRHPDHARVGVFLWAHHEKLIVVDQSYTFFGGIDLCYGRWDDYRHRLTDLGSIATSSSSGSFMIRNKRGLTTPTGSTTATPATTTTVDGKCLTNPPDVVRKLPQLEPGDPLMMSTPFYAQTAVDGDNFDEHMKQDTPEMERKNYLEKFKDSVKTRGQSFMHRLTSNDPNEMGSRSVPQSPTNTNKKYHLNPKHLFFGDDEVAEGRKGGAAQVAETICAFPPQNEILTKLDGQAKYWMGKDYTNFILKDFTNLEAPYADLVDRSVTPRMPWHDIGGVAVGTVARDMARHFIQRWNAVKLEKARDNLAYPYLMPKAYADITVMEQLLNVPLQRVSCQVLRSVATWNCGFIEPDLVEQSIHEAYLHTITHAEHYVYIENQFFITLEQGNQVVKNQVGEALFNRILRAHKQHKVFRVYIVMPLLPGFEGDVGGTTGTALRAITHWNYASISRGKHSIIQRLKAAGVEDPSQYISFHSLRTHSTLADNSPVTELIYVHSKLMIVDDRVVICGSANINDRSLIGLRDSEIACIMRDEQFKASRMNGEPWMSGLFAGSLRRYLFREHLGLIEGDPERVPIDITDPVIDSFWIGQWQRTSQRNTRIYDEVFRCIPTDSVVTFSKLKRYVEEPSLAKTDPQAAMKEIARIQGYLVDLPLKFLENEILTPPAASKEGLIPTTVWT